MNFLVFFVAALCLLDPVQPSKLPYDQVAPFPEVLPTTIENAVALKFKPQLHIRNGCHPYPAVDADGNTNAGLGIMKVFTSCKGSPLGSQVYGRMLEYKGVVGIMYAWCFPRDFMISPMTYTPPKPEHMDGSSVKIKYTWLIQPQHFLSGTTKAGEFQDLVMWDNMTDAARDALEDTRFFWSKAPMNNDKFEDNLIKAYPF